MALLSEELKYFKIISVNFSGAAATISFDVYRNEEVRHAETRDEFDQSIPKRVVISLPLDTVDEFLSAIYPLVKEQHSSPGQLFHEATDI